MEFVYIIVSVNIIGEPKMHNKTEIFNFSLLLPIYLSLFQLCDKKENIIGLNFSLLLPNYRSLLQLCDSKRCRS